MNLNNLGLPFKESGIEWRIGQAGKTGAGGVWATCLAYVSARAIMHRLDEVCGPQNWKTEYVIHHSHGVICRLGIKIGDEWVVKEDGAEQTEIEPFKGAISGALKRAGSAWGIGRYLYDLESGFATICQKGAPGARYAKTKEGEVFYWTPPQLPAWALPAPLEATPVPPEPRKTLGQWLEQPGQGDGTDDGVYRVPFHRKINGRDMKNRTFDQIGREDLEEAVRLIDWAEELKQPIMPDVIVFRRLAIEYVVNLDTMFENQSQERP